jgi:hypothetical protein
VNNTQRKNVEKLLAYLTKLKETGQEEKFVMSTWLFDLEKGWTASIGDELNWHCGTAGCLAGSWYIMLKQQGERVTKNVEPQFMDDFSLDDEDAYYVTSGQWSPHGLDATLDDAIDYLTLSLTRDLLVPEYFTP